MVNYNCPSEKAWLQERWDRAQAMLVVTFSITFHPRNLVFCSIYPSRKEQGYKAYLNGLSVQYLASLENLPLVLEFLFALAFLSGLYLMISSHAPVL